MIYIAILVVVVGFRAAVSARLNKVEEGIKNETFRITQLNQKEALYTILENKVSLGGDFLNNRISLKDEFEKIVELLPEGAHLNKFRVSDDNNSVSVGIVTDDVYVAVMLLDEFESLVEREEYEFVVIDGLNRGEDGKYIIIGEMPI